jgi:hypothetical protein
VLLFFGRTLRGGFFGKLSLTFGFSDTLRVLLMLLLDGGDLAEVGLGLKESYGFLMLGRFGEVWGICVHF